MREFKESGKAILFVTHDVSAVKSLCDRAAWLEKGRIQDYGEPEHVVARYLAAMFGQPEREIINSVVLPADAEPAAIQSDAHRDSPILRPETEIPNIDRRFGDGRAEIIGIGVYDENNQRVASIAHGRPVQIRVSVRFGERVVQPIVGYVFRNRLGVDLASTNTDMEGSLLPSGESGTVLSVRFKINLPVLASGPYSLSVAVADGNYVDYTMCDWIDNIFVLQMLAEKDVPSMMRFPTRCEIELTGKTQE
jgi:hypothetical protein